jgi:U32 family peptidase
MGRVGPGHSSARRTRISTLRKNPRCAQSIVSEPRSGYLAGQMSVPARTAAGSGGESPAEPVRPELLAPAGDWECARAAVENGADGIYFGLERFNARMRAHNFTLTDLPELMAFLHRRGVKAYVTFNTLVFVEELAEAEVFLRAIIGAGVDAAIVQDVGMARLIRAMSPDFPMHASTQMTVTSVAGLAFARQVGCDRVILARECSLRDLEQMRQEMAAAAAPGHAPERWPELEIFVHGALCVAYSGQCLTSEALGGRSANRGECAQACRMPFELICDGQVVPLGERRYLLSPQDLAAVELLPDIVRLGVGSIKIEGRLKSPEYVANITRLYRQALDGLGAARPVGGPAQPSTSPAPVHSGQGSGQARYEMEMAFSRGLYTGWLRGINNQQLVHARFGKKRGVFLGQVSRVQPDRVWLRLEAPVKPGDGVVFDAGRPDQEEQGGRVYEVRRPHGAGPVRTTKPAPRQPAPMTLGEVALTFGRGDLDFGRIHPGDKVWKTSDPELERRVRQTYSGEQVRFQRPLRMEARGAAGQPMTLIVQDEEGRRVELESAMPLCLAEHHPITPDRLRDQLGRLGGTPFRLGELVCALKGQVMLPLSELNRLRREAVSRLEALRMQPRHWTLHPSAASRPGNAPFPLTLTLSLGEREQVTHATGQSLNGEPRSGPSQPSSEAAPELVVLVRNLDQMEAVLCSEVSDVYCEFEDPKQYREAVRRFRQWQETASRPPAPASLFVVPPRITKPGEEWILQQVRSSQPDGYVVRNYDHLRFFQDCRRIGDFSFNVANPIAADYFIVQCGLERIVASYDLNADQLAGLLRAAPPAWFEITLHQHMPMFHMDHCVFCAFLSRGTDYTNCGRPCDQHTVELRDRVGARHLVKADAGCRNTVHNALAQTGAESAARFLALGARRFRVEFLNESPERVLQTVRMYWRLLHGEVAGTQLWRELKLLNRLGVTRGQKETDYSRLPKWGEIEW